MEMMYNQVSRSFRGDKYVYIRREDIYEERGEMGGS